MMMCPTDIPVHIWKEYFIEVFRFTVITTGILSLFCNPSCPPPSNVRLSFKLVAYHKIKTQIIQML